MSLSKDSIKVVDNYLRELRNPKNNITDSVEDINSIRKQNYTIISWIEESKVGKIWNDDINSLNKDLRYNVIEELNRLISKTEMFLKEQERLNRIKKQKKKL